MPVVRILLRVDYETCFDLMDGVGKTSRTILEAADDPKYFAQLVEGTPNREVRAIYHDDELRRDLKVAPNAIVIDYHNYRGIALSGIRQDRDFEKLVHIMTNLRRAYPSIRTEVRTGLRMIYVGSIPANREHVVSTFRSLLSESMSSLVTKSLAEPTDYGMNFDGGMPGDVQYHLRCGPFLGYSEIEKYFDGAKPGDDLEIFEKSNFVCDLDQYQMKTQFGSELVWWKELLIKAAGLIPQIENVVFATTKRASH